MCLHPYLVHALHVCTARRKICGGLTIPKSKPTHTQTNKQMLTCGSQVRGEAEELGAALDAARAEIERLTDALAAAQSPDATHATTPGTQVGHTPHTG